ncbi:protein of unknown function [Pseudoxanthomonas sp. GM95]|nr:protein of unknown function [Pseudoxanthomonas sp. GM95]
MIKILFRINFLFLVLWCPHAFAEGGCPTGQTPRAFGAVMGCVPGGNDELPARASQPTGTWIKTWGAIANATNDVMGATTGQRTKREAGKIAVENCKREGGVGCKLIYPYENRCVAMAGGFRAPDDYRVVTQASSSVEASSALVIDGCSESGARECKVFYSACSEPIFIKF